MRHCRLLGLLVALTTWVAAAGLVFAAGKGQDDLDRATEKKLSAESPEDWDEVIKLCRSAKLLGLDADNEKFCNDLLSSTLFQRASIFTDEIFERTPPNVRWPRLRQAALSDLEQVVQLKPDFPQARLMIARLAVLPGGDTTRAKTELDALLKIKDLEPEDQSQALVLRGNLTDDADKRLADYNEAIKIAPKFADAYRSRGMHYVLGNQPEKALPDLEESLKLAPKHLVTLETKGLVLAQLDRTEEARKTYDAVLKMDPSSAPTYVHRGRLAAQTKDFDGAIRDFTKALELDPNNLGALMLRARSHQQKGDKKAAQADLQKALAAKPGLPVALEMRGILAASNGDLNGAIADFKQLEKVSPKNAGLQTQLGILHTANGQPRAAIAAYSAALELDPKDFVALRGRGDAYLGVGKHAEAIKDFEAAYKIRKDDPSLLNNFAWVLATSPEDKLRDGKRSIELGTAAGKLTDYKQAHILSTIAAGYAETGDFDSAIEWEKKAHAVASKEMLPDLEKEMKSFEAKKPIRELQNIPEGPGKGPKAPEKAAADKSPAKDDAAKDAKSSDDKSSDSKSESKKPAEKKADEKKTDGKKADDSVDPVKREPLQDDADEKEPIGPAL